MKLELWIKNTENIGNLSEEEMKKIEEICSALVTSGSLTGVKGGKTIIHFDSEGVFMGVSLDYWPFRRRTKH